jgi:uncharacterized LabA/DUF88 family protein
MSTSQPNPPRAVVFIDGQNLMHDAERAFGYSVPNYDVKKLAQAVCDSKKWSLAETRFYTGVPTIEQNKRWKEFWDNKIFLMRASGVSVCSRKLKDRETKIILYKRLRVSCPASLPGAEPRDVGIDPCWITDTGICLEHDTVVKQTVFTEKGIDVSIAVDSIRYALEGRCEVFLFFSQDSDLAPAVQEIKQIGNKPSKALTLACAFPSADGSGYGIPHCDVIVRMDQKFYDQCLDDRDHFRKKK